MSAEDRRRMIVQAVLPLVVEHGAAVTTAQIARAAGIGEGTIFRAFKDKDELLDACVAEALKPDSALAVVAEIPLDQPLADRLTEAAEALSAHLERMGALMGALHSSGRLKRGEPRKGSRAESFTAMREAITELFTPEDRLRLPAEQLAGVFMSLLFSRRRDDQAGLSTAELIDVFLHGAVSA
ncbi:TetR/AcrR family transcriptional regulator [Amycolatopsis thermoflava]|uniref:TetR/AcrR family transcriptional regulator n=1 Tax=Amycolatopsis thermoflava TaxID=84480 RepID=UPI00042008D6|nr:TetR/AcrR family transcriptional regulator [Amycolatopsis thermoflava]